MYCHECKKEMAKTSDTHEYVECGLRNIWLESWPGFRCQSCLSFLPILPDADRLDKFIIAQLLMIERHLSAEEILFLRSALNLKPAALADAIAVEKRVITRAERNKEILPPAADLQLRDHVLQKFFSGQRPDIKRKILSFYHDGFGRETVNRHIIIKKEDLEMQAT